VSARLEGRLRDALAGSALEERVALVLDPFVTRRGDDAAARALAGPALLGLARALVTSLEAARFLAHRPLLLERIASAGPDALSQRGAALGAAAAATPEDLEGGLDGLRLLRREETLFAAALWFGGLAEFETASVFLSELAEAILAQTLARAQGSLGGGESTASLAVLGMGKVGGREFTFHSDLDLIFLCRGGVEAVVKASRVAQRLIAYLTTRTGAGVAYAVDSRLRPSGNQGLLVTTLDSFARYQRDDAQTWEHLALMRARVIAGDVANAAPALAAVHEAIVARRLAAWGEIADMRRKVEAQRADEASGKIAFKTGAGGLMDVDFLAAGSNLERGADGGRPAFPGNAALLRAAQPGPVTEGLLAAYGSLRRVEACARWVLGRPAETLEPESESFRWLEALAAPGEPPGTLRGRVADARREIRAGFDAVVSARSIEALRDGG
jgi:glutamate-ammonia-ligase adenylyltransferase